MWPCFVPSEITQEAASKRRRGATRVHARARPDDDSLWGAPELCHKVLRRCRVSLQARESKSEGGPISGDCSMEFPSGAPKAIAHRVRLEGARAREFESRSPDQSN